MRKINGASISAGAASASSTNTERSRFAREYHSCGSATEVRLGVSLTSFGGSISSIGSAARDPLFFLLHCNVDRLWAKWQWLNQRYDGAQGEVFLEGSHKRLLAGTTDDPFFKLLDEGVPALARHALAIAHGD